MGPVGDLLSLSPLSSLFSLSSVLSLSLSFVLSFLLSFFLSFFLAFLLSCFLAFCLLFSFFFSFRFPLFSFVFSLSFSLFFPRFFFFFFFLLSLLSLFLSLSLCLSLSLSLSLSANSHKGPPPRWVDDPPKDVHQRVPSCKAKLLSCWCDRQGMRNPLWCPFRESPDSFPHSRLSTSKLSLRTVLAVNRPKRKRTARALCKGALH